MSTSSIEKILSEEDKLSSKNLDCLLRKNISDISLDDLKQIEKIAIFKDNVTVQEIKEIENMLFKDSVTWDNSILPLFVMSIVGYYLDNNFYTDLKVFINKLKVPSLAELIIKIEKYIDSFKDNKLLYPVLVNRYQSLLTYYQIYHKESLTISKDVDNIIVSADDRLNKSLKFLSNLLEIPNLDNKFRAVNSIYSYTNYEIPFLLLDLNQNRKSKLEDYVSYFEKFISEISDDIVKNTSDVAKIVFLNNLKFIYDITNYLQLDKSSYLALETDFVRYISLLNYDGDTNGFKAFSRDYSGLDLGSDNIFSPDNVCYSSLLDLCSKGLEVISIANILSEYSLNQTIRRYSKIFFDVSVYKLIDKDNVVLTMENVLTTSNLYLDKVFFDLLARSNDISLSTYEIFLKEVGIKLLGIETNYHNLYVEIEINNKKEKIKDNFKPYEMSLILDESIWIDGDIVRIKYFVPNNITINESKIYSRYKINKGKLKKILKNIIKTRLSIKKFFYDVNLKISKLRTGIEAHLETVEHMEKLGKLFGIILNDKDLNKEYRVLEKIADKLFLDINTFLKYIGYLHDIGKTDNIHKIHESKNINTRSYMSVGVYYFVTSTLGFKGFKFDILENEYFSKNACNLKIKVSNPSIVDKLIEDYYSMLSTKNVNHMVFGDYLKKSFIKLVKDVSNYIVNSQQIIREEIKQELVDAMRGKGIPIDVNEVDIFFMSIIYILGKLSNLTYRDVSSPHITYGMHFFSLHREFDYLSWVLFHHDRYPMIEEVKYYEIESGLKKWANMIGYDYNDYFRGADDNMPILSSNKDVYMVILTFLDIIDALLSKRSYQEIDDEIYVFENLFRQIFIPEVSNNLLSRLKGEQFSSPEEVFDKKILPIMDNEFKNNPFYSKVRNVVLKHKDEIIAMYKPLRNKD